MDDLISRQAAIDTISVRLNKTDAPASYPGIIKALEEWLNDLPSVQPERLTDDDFETIRIHLSAIKEKLCNQHRWEEAEMYEQLIERFMVFVSARPEQQWILCSERLPKDGKWCLFTDGVNISVERYKADAIDHFFPQGRWFSLEDAVAWMPLPEPYREESN